MTDTETTRTDRVVIDGQFIDIYKALVEGENIETTPFRTFKDVFMMAVCYGFNKDSREPSPGSSSHTIRLDVFTEDDKMLLNAIAIATTGDVDVLMQKSKILTIAESYAQTGIIEVRYNLLDQPGLPLWNLVGIMKV